MQLSLQGVGDEGSLSRRSATEVANGRPHINSASKLGASLLGRSRKRLTTDRDRVYMGQLAAYARAEEERLAHNDRIRAEGGDLELLRDGAQVLTAKDREYFRRRRGVKHLFTWRSTFENLVGLFAALAFGIAILISEHNSGRKRLIWDGDCGDPDGPWIENFALNIPCVDKESLRDDYYIVVCKLCIMVLSVASIVVNTGRYFMEKKIAELRFIAPPHNLCVALCVSPVENLGFLLETALLLFSIPPYVDSFWKSTEVEVLGGANYWLPVNSIMTLLSLRFVFLLRVMRNFSGYANQNVAYVGAMNGVDSTSIFFSFRMFFREEPIKMLAIATPTLIFVASACLIMVERFAPSSNIKNWHDAVWCTIVSLTTVGFGDLYPATVSGRCVRSAERAPLRPRPYQPGPVSMRAQFHARADPARARRASPLTPPPPPRLARTRALNQCPHRHLPCVLRHAADDGIYCNFHRDHGSKRA